MGQMFSKQLENSRHLKRVIKQTKQTKKPEEGYSYNETRIGQMDRGRITISVAERLTEQFEKIICFIAEEYSNSSLLSQVIINIDQHECKIAVDNHAKDFETKENLLQFRQTYFLLQCLKTEMIRILEKLGFNESIDNENEDPLSQGDIKMMIKAFTKEIERLYKKYSSEPEKDRLAEFIQQDQLTILPYYEGFFSSKGEQESKCEENSQIPQKYERTQKQQTIPKECSKQYR